MEHSKLPWKVLYAHDHDEYAGVMGHNQRCTGTEFVVPMDIRLENAAFIVTACNAHATLKAKAELLDKFVAFCNEEVPESPIEKCGIEICQELNELLTMYEELTK